MTARVSRQPSGLVGNGGAHDVGGRDSGPIRIEGPHAWERWEILLEGLNSVMARRGLRAPDELRAYIEEIPAEEQARLSYYARWAVASHRHLQAIGGLPEPGALPKPLAPSTDSIYCDPCLDVGDVVRAKVEVGGRRHQKLPGYLRGKVGVVDAVIGRYPDPSLLADRVRHGPHQWLYDVRFTAEELWGPDPKRTERADAFSGVDELHADLYEKYLDRLGTTSYIDAPEESGG